MLTDFVSVKNRALWKYLVHLDKFVSLMRSPVMVSRLLVMMPLMRIVTGFFC
jgi:hypothetical protein